MITALDERLSAHRSDFKPAAPRSWTSLCGCPHCGTWAPFIEWGYQDGMDDGFWCVDCHDFHSCFVCPNPECEEQIGAAGAHNGYIQVRER